MKDEGVVVNTLKSAFGDAIVGHEVFRGQLSVHLAKERLLDVLKFCRDNARLQYDMLTDFTAVDFLPRQPRFQLVYNLYSFPRNERLLVKVALPENETIPTVEGIWRAANWLEREVYDLFGIVFENHSDLRRILLWDGYVGHPLRKDFPLLGVPQKVVYR